MQHAAFGFMVKGLQTQHNLSTFGEFNCITHEVNQNLPQANGITLYLIGYVVADFTQNFQPFFMGAQRQWP